MKERYQTPVHTRCRAGCGEAIALSGGSEWKHVVDVATAIGLLWKKRGAAGVMIGRGAIRNPWIFGQLKQALRGRGGDGGAAGKFVMLYSDPLG